MSTSDLLLAFSPAMPGGKINGRWRAKYEKEGLAILNAVPDAESISEAIFRIKNGIERPKCATCDGPVKFSHKHHEYSRFCSPRCGQLNSEVRAKLKQTNLEKYGIENPGAFGSDKFKEAMQEKYGVDTPMKSKSIKDKIKSTNLERYGVENVFASIQGKKKIVDTMLKNYGVQCSMKDPGVKQKFRTEDGSWKPAITNVELRRSNQLTTNIDKVKQRLHEVGFTLIEKRGTFKYHKNKHLVQHICGNIFESELTNGMDPICRKCNPKLIGTSKIQQKLEEEISKHVHIEVGKRLLGKQEIDIFIPSHNLGIEVNGLYWHSELAGKSRRYHQEKTELALANGIQLLQFYEDTLTDRFDAVVSLILAKLGKSNRIFARKCKIKIIQNQLAKEFFNQNHLQGSSKISISIGLYFQDTLVAVGAFGKPRYNKEHEWELLRFCSLNNYTVVGGFSKILKFFCTTYKPKSILSYADRSYSNGNVYEQSGFTKIATRDAGYYYIRSNEIKRYHRSLFQKHKLKNKLLNFNPEISEWENMKVNGWNRIWDSGQLVYSLNLGIVD